MITDEKIKELLSYLDETTDFEMENLYKTRNIEFVRNWLEENGLIWIPIEKRKPEIMQMCILHFDWADQDVYHVTWYNGEKHITHWMPLPDLPNNKGDKNERRKML